MFYDRIVNLFRTFYHDHTNAHKKKFNEITNRFENI